MADSHHSSRVNFENSTPDLDLLQQIAGRHSGCLGSRLCGGGWGGNTVNLVTLEAVDDFTTTVTNEFAAATGRSTTVQVCHAADGASGMCL
jgi:galactokinase